MPAKLFEPITAGALKLEHRVVLAPLTRLRASWPDAIPASYAKDYYEQRASAGGLLITEGTTIAKESGGMQQVPGIYNDAQIEGWKPIVEAVHAKGGKIFTQLWATGRVTGRDTYPTSWSPGTIPYQDIEPTQMKKEDIERFVGHYRHAAECAIKAGFDGVEIHNANGYLLDQFLQKNANNRTDEFGGSLENRFRFPLAVLDAVCEAIGADRVGIRISPFSKFQDMREDDPLAVFEPFSRAIVEHQPKLAYVHAVEGRVAGASDAAEKSREPTDTLDSIREIVTTAGVRFMVAGGYVADSALERTEDTDDMIAFGRYFIANPDLPDRIKNGYPFTDYNRDTFYTHDEEGYTTYKPYQSKL